MNKVELQDELVPELRFSEFEKNSIWEIKSLNSIAKNLSNRRIPITSNVREKGEIPYYGATGVIDYVKDYIFNENLLLISEDGANLIDRNYPIAYSISGKTWVNNHAHVLKPINEHIQMLVEKYINSISIEDYLTGQAQPKLNKANLNKIPVPIPENPKEQQKIANCLSSLDNVITAETEKLDHLKNHKKGLLQQLFPAKSETKPQFRFSEFKNDGDWEIKKLSKLGKLINGLTYSPKDVRKQGLLVLRSSNVQNSRILLDDCVFVRTDISGANITSPNDILICVRNGSKRLIGKNAIIPDGLPLATHGAFMTMFRANNPSFVFQLFQTESYKYQVKADLGATINSINGKNFVKYEFAVPKNPKEQEKLSDFLSSVDDLIEAQTTKIEALKDHKNGLIQRLFPNVNDIS
jgi:type I restriction enzyme S subunit